ncbi:hypothetical protein EDB81DRAFT_247881 [Dactylonectria macrodidyma]|uniref:Uncharacterized protein n=1 Tax=Dactylonectria macrodidyma TaxID=307937 RepID=A0A9P9D9R8_9HYPO|nr:hypothetical protein EDB81DRAFT_247881 [Dactylonectria macrodidyma]
MLQESREETVKQIMKMHEEAVKEITSAHERMIETLRDAWKKEQQALKQMIASQEKSIGKLQQDIQSIQEQATRERKLMQDQMDELKRIQQTWRDPEADGLGKRTGRQQSEIKTFHAPSYLVIYHRPRDKRIRHRR